MSHYNRGLCIGVSLTSLISIMIIANCWWGSWWCTFFLIIQLAILRGLSLDKTPPGEGRKTIQGFALNIHTGGEVSLSRESPNNLPQIRTLGIELKRIIFTYFSGSLPLLLFFPGYCCLPWHSLTLFNNKYKVHRRWKLRKLLK